MAGSATVQFDVNTAQCMLKDANTHFAAMLPAVDVQPGWDAVSGHAQAYVASVQGLQQQLAAFAAPVPSNAKAALEQEVSALQTELARADALLEETNCLVQQWQMRCQDLRNKHVAVLTSGIGAQAMTVGAQADQQQDTHMADAAAQLTQ